MRDARRLDLEPTIEIRQDEVSVSIIIFTAWGGFARDETVFDRAFPHLVVEHNREFLVRYDCGILFEDTPGV